jgi:hypothetical protein
LGRPLGWRRECRTWGGEDDRVQLGERREAMEKEREGGNLECVNVMGRGTDQMNCEQK